MKSPHSAPDSHGKTIQDRVPNFRGKGGRLFLLRCFNCDTAIGVENPAPYVASGTCAWCGWTENDGDKEKEQA